MSLLLLLLFLLLLLCPSSSLHLRPSMAAIARGAWHWYQRQSKARPIRTQVISSGLLWATGDCLAQQVDLSMSRQRRRVEQRERESNASKLHLAVLNPEQVRNEIDFPDFQIFRVFGSLVTSWYSAGFRPQVLVWICGLLFD